MSKKGAEIIIDILRCEGVKDLFGIPGGAVIDIFDMLYDADINFYLMRHEQAAAHAADGYARATGKVGVCIATSGPGATNLVTGIATAYMDSIPLVALTGQVATKLIGNDAFQEADTTGITRPITKHNYLVRTTDELPRILKEAFYLARTGRPGPVLVDLPKDVQQGETNEKYPDKIELRSYKPTLWGHPGQIKKLANAIKHSKRPVIYAGGGVISSGASEELRELAIKAKIPVTTTLMGLGVFPETHPLSLKMLGMHGTQYANYAIMEADLLIAIGARFDDRVTGKVEEFAPKAKIAHIDIDPSSIRKNVNVDIPVVGDVKNVLSELNKILQPGDTSEWLKQIEQWKRDYPLTYREDGNLKPQYVIEQIYEVTKGKAIITTEVGQNQMWAAQFYKFTKPRTFLSSGGLGTMGYGFPAALGAQVACPDHIVFDVAGDGSFQMNIQELATAVNNNLPVKIAILNNGYLGMVRQWQEMFYNKRYSGVCLVGDYECVEKHTDSSGKQPLMLLNFVKIAEAYGAVGIRVTKKKQVREALEEALAIPKPVVLDFHIEPEENVFPMVPAGASLNQMIGGLA
ncbi:biosynthetic-type acetolactate synthase large subunit [candidate division KSB1 bacterium]|nr:MAG: biosynthetic-type acetolactate synthase large subunit [candidate division KSB1 bacterium]